MTTTLAIFVSNQTPMFDLRPEEPAYVRGPDSIAGARVNPPALRPRGYAAERHIETTTLIQRPRPHSGELWN